MSVIEHFRTQQGGFWREDIKAFFFSFPRKGGSLTRAVSSSGRFLVAQSPPQIS